MNQVGSEPLPLGGAFDAAAAAAATWPLNGHARLRVLIFTAAVGSGHVAAGQALRADLEHHGHAAVVLDGLHLMGRVMDGLMRPTYFTQVRIAPWSLRPVFVAFTRHPLAGAIHRLTGWRYAARFLATIAAHQPDVVVSTYPLVNGVLGALRRSGLLGIPTVALIADYGVHPMWVDPWLDLHLVASPPSAGLAARAGGRAVVVRPPVAAGFRAAPDRQLARQALGLPPDAFIALIVGGSWGVGDLAGAAQGAVAAGAQPVVVAGRNEAVRSRLAAVFAHDERVRVLGWADDMPALMRASDCLVQNAGGMTCVEAIAVGLPVLLFQPIPGHGELNARVMQQAGVARWVRTPAELQETIGAAVRGERPLVTPAPNVDAPDAVTAVEACAPGRARAAPARLRR